MHKLDDILVGDYVPGRKARRYGSILLLLFAVGCGVATYTKDRLIGSTDVSIRPDMVSTIIAACLISSLYIRRIVPRSASVFSLLSFGLNLTVTAIFIQAILGAASSSWISVPMPFIVGAALGLTWLGIRPLAPLGWGLVLLFGFWNLQAASDAMGIWGYLFAMSAFAGIILQFDFKVDEVLNEIRYDFVGGASGQSIEQAEVNRE
ncbi:hypothetical protein LGQ03_08790 [Loktanella sp. TSTF-M6]|uniref:Inner membrane protein n=1 Tax=Loktanella gaetbuli TaxID=2881335 RepID=A0ABS8BUE8_9RHOB|nr:hypothetical protein [Loktanella gaetbuli]MCB5199337.1 hypothetical protein [Loktanella gaetbuli]